MPLDVSSTLTDNSARENEGSRSFVDSRLVLILSAVYNGMPLQRTHLRKAHCAQCHPMGAERCWRFYDIGCARALSFVDSFTSTLL